MHWASGGHSCNAGAETPLGAKPGCLWMIREKPCYSGFAWPMLQGFTVYCTDWKENALLVQNTGEECGSREAAFWGASGSVFLTGLLEKGLWPKIRLIYSHVRIAPHPNCKEWVEMGAAETPGAGHGQVTAHGAGVDLQQCPAQWRRMNRTNWLLEGGGGTSGTCLKKFVSGNFRLRLRGWGWHQANRCVSWELRWWNDTACLRTAMEMDTSPVARCSSPSEAVPVSSGCSCHWASSQSDCFWSLLIWAGLKATA